MIGRRELSAIESLGETFEESGDHVVAEAEFSRLRLAPLVPIRTERLGAGEFGWEREVRTGENRAARLALIAQPIGSDAAQGPEEIAQRLGGTLATGRTIGGTPTVMLLALDVPAKARAIIARLFERVAEELDAEP